MRVTHSARRSLASTLLALALAACGSEGSGPSEFDPQGTSADMGASQEAFASEPTASFAALGGDISLVLGGSPVLSSSAALALSRPSKASALYASRIAALVPTGGARIQASVASIPSELAGVTYVWDEVSDAYVASDIAGAPSNGVRFLLYAVDPVLLRPVEPVVETGYVDVIDQSTLSTLNVRVKVVQANVTYLDYTVTGSGSSASANVTVAGYAFNGSLRANFTLKHTVTQNGQDVLIALDYGLDVPARNLSIDWTATIANFSDTDVAITLDLTVSGPNGNVRVVGTLAATSGAFTVKVNGDTYATVTLTDSGPVITGAGGQPLTAEEEAALQDVFASYEGSLAVFSQLLLPVG